MPNTLRESFTGAPATPGTTGSAAPTPARAPQGGSGPADGVRSLACHGDAADIHAWSNIPYFLFRAAHARGFLTHALNLTRPDYRRRRFLWNLRAPLRLEKPGGYQYSPAAVERMWQCVPEALRRGEIVSHFQLFPPPRRIEQAGMRHVFYGDATLRNLWGDHPPAGVGRRTADDALRREGEMYRSARFFLGMARATVDSAVRDYGVDPAKAFVVRPGANMDESAVQAYLQRRGPSWREARRKDGRDFTADRPALLGFIGRDYVRKGLPRLVEAADILHARGRHVRVSVIGHCPERFRAHPRVDWVGFIDKSTDMARFIEATDRFALGCLPSYQEPLGISTLEALRLGVPVMGADTGGIPDCVPEDGGFLVPRDATGGDIADAVERNVFDPDRYDHLQAGATREMANVTWESTVLRMIEVWSADAKACRG